MAFDRTIRLYEPDGLTLDSSYYPGGLINWSATRPGACTDARCILGAYGGCLDSSIVIAGDARDARRIPAGSVVKFYYASGDGTPVYAGVVQARTRLVEGFRHEYQLRGLWRELEKTDISARDTSHTSTDVETIVQALYDDHISGLDLITGSSISTASVAVAEFIIEKNASIYRLLEQLAMMQSSDGDYWVAGVDQAGVFYFSPVSTAAGNIQATFEIGSDVIRGREEDATYKGSNRITVVGAITSDGYVTKKGFEDAVAIAANGETPRRKLPTPALRKNADLANYAAGYFDLFANPQQYFDGVERVHTDGDTVPVPSSGRGLVTDTQRGDLHTDYIKTLYIDFNKAFRVRADVGRVSLTPATQIEPSPVKDFYEAMSADGDVIDMLPEATEDDAPYTDAPGFVPGGAGHSELPGGGAGLNPGAIQEVHASPVLQKNTNMTFQVKINLAGQAAGTGTVTIHYTVYANNEIAVSKSGTASGVSIWNDGNYEVYEATITGMPNDVGWVHARVESAKIGGSGSYWFPNNTGLYRFTKVIDTAAGSGDEHNYYVAATSLYEGS